MDQGSDSWIVNSGTDAAPKWRWEYNLTDHLGNVRVVLGDSTAAGYARVLQQNHYYPFGMRMSEISTSLADTSNNYLYNGKEFQDDFGLNWYDYGARFYDPALGRWNSVDPMCNRHYDCSPYVYVLDNPVKSIDLYGYTDWNAIWQGSAAFVGGLGSTIGGVAAICTPTGVGQIGGAVLVSTGIPAMGLGIAKVITGIIDNGSAKNVPLGMGETLGMAGDAVAGNENGELRKAGAVTDIVTGVAAAGGKLPATLIEKAALASLVAGTISDIAKTNSDTGSQETGNATNTGSQTTSDASAVTVSDNTTVVTTPVKNIDAGKTQVDQKTYNEYFGK